MAKQIEFDGKVHEFPDDFTDADIAAALSPSAPTRERSVADFGSNVLSSAGKMASGVASAALHPYETGKNLAITAFGLTVPRNEMGREMFPQASAARDAFGDFYKNRYGGIEALKNTAYEDPVGMASDVSAALGIGGGVARGVGKMAGLPPVIKAGEVMGTVSNAANPLSLPGTVARTVLPTSVRGRIAERMYQSALKPPVALGEAKAITQTGLREQIPVGSVFGLGDGLTKARGVIDDLNLQVKNEIATGAAAGKTVDPMAVAPYTARSTKRFTNQVNPAADLSSIDNATREFLERKGGARFDSSGAITTAPRSIPVDEAQAIKQGTYQKLRESYGELSGAAKEAQKDLARGLKEEIYTHFPGLKDVGKREGALIDLEGALERFAQRHGNRDLVGIGTPIAGTAVGAVTGNATAGALAGVAKAALDNPFIKSKIAIALNKSARGSRSTLPAKINIGAALARPQYPLLAAEEDQ